MRAFLKEYLPLGAQDTIKAIRDEVVYRIKYPYRWARSHTVHWRFHPLPGGRQWKSDLTPRQHISMYRGTLRYKYKGLPCLRYPLDMTLYTQLFWELKPRTIIEIGSKAGGSAQWMADITVAMGLDTVIHSIDLLPPKLHISGVQFHQGDESALEEVMLPWSSLPPPWLVINDASHQYSSMINCMTFLQRLMKSGDYMIIEDGYLTELGEDRGRNGGPARAITDFLRMHPEWEIDTRYCDWYGYNLTANPNGYLRRR